MEAARILVIEDEKHIAEGIELNLKLLGHQVEIAKTGVEGLRRWSESAFDLIVLDLMLPGIDGLGVLKQIRGKDERVPILVVSAKDQDIDKIKALQGGVDDYLTKPFNLDEFLLRISGLLKRSQWTVSGKESPGPEKDNYFSFGKNRIDFVRQEANCNGKIIKLTAQEIKLLELFLQNIGRPLSREEILELGWGLDGNLSTRTVDNFIVRFRKYFEQDAKKPQFFKSIRSVGYIFEI